MLVGSSSPSLSPFTSLTFDHRWLYEKLLVNDFTFDSLTVTPKQTNFAAGVDYMTDYDEWLRIQVEIYTLPVVRQTNAGARFLFTVCYISHSVV